MSPAFDRIEPNHTDETLLEGLQARVADPLWFLARQWQSGELDGEDAATPIEAKVTLETIPLTTLETPSGTRRRLNANGPPLEALVEAVAPTAGSAEDIASLATAAIQRLAEAKLDTAKRRAALRKHYPFDAEAHRGAHPLPKAAARRLRFLARHSFDPGALVADRGQALLRQMPELGDWVSDLIAAAQRRGTEIAGKSDTWNGHDLAYQARVSGRAIERRIDLELADYGGGHLDWYSFDGAPPDGAQPYAGKGSSEDITMVPLPLSYAGQPVSRFWEFEDGDVHFGGISSGPADIARMIVADFAAIGGDDMFVFPLDVPVGSAVRVARLQLRDTFGRDHQVMPASEKAAAQAGKDRLPFLLYRNHRMPAAAKGADAWLPILPVATGSQRGRALERVVLRRDEDANLAWAVEEEVEGPFGRALRRRQAWEIADPVEIGEDAPWPYKLQTDVPPWWIPLVPQREGRGAETYLRRARMGAWQTMPADTVGPKSRLMDSTRPVTIAEAALPKSGLRLTRHWQIARGYDGRPVLWQSWQRESGATDRVSGLTYDMIARKW